MPSAAAPQETASPTSWPLYPTWQPLQVPGGREPLDASLPAVGVDLVVVVRAQLEAFLLRALCRAPGGLARTVEKGATVHRVDRTLLELHGVGTAGPGRVDQLLGDRQAAVVIDADLGDDEDAHAGLHIAAPGPFRDLPPVAFRPRL